MIETVKKRINKLKEELKNNNLTTKEKQEITCKLIVLNEILIEMLEK